MNRKEKFRMRITSIVDQEIGNVIIRGLPDNRCNTNGLTARIVLDGEVLVTFKIGGRCMVNGFSKIERETLWISKEEFAKAGSNRNRLLALEEKDNAVLEVIE